MIYSYNLILSTDNLENFGKVNNMNEFTPKKKYGVKQ